MEREYYLKQVGAGFNVHPVVAILGPRQCGKTTLARQFIKKESSKVHYFDMEDPNDLALFDNAKQLLGSLEGMIVIDEIQRKANLFPLLRVLVDRDNNKQRYLILGSASPELIKQSSETLAGRVQFMELTPFSWTEVGNSNKLWLRGGFPKSFLADTTEKSEIWREHYIRTFLERDMPNLGIKISPINMRRFWSMLTHYHGNIFNASELARSLGLSQPTIKHYIDILTNTFMIRQLQPWFENISKRQVKMPKIYFRDTGILHSLLNLSHDEILRHPKLGASWEGYALEEVIRRNNARSEECYFWATHSGAEIDLLIVKGEKKFGFEFKYTDSPKITKSIHVCKKSLNLENITIISPGVKEYELDKNIFICGLENYLMN